MLYYFVTPFILDLLFTYCLLTCILYDQHFNAFSGKKPVYMERGMTRPMAASPKFIQGKREKSKDFMKRVEVETRKVLHRHQLSQKFKVLGFIYTEFLCEPTLTYMYYSIASLGSFCFKSIHIYIGRTYWSIECLNNKMLYLLVFKQQ